RSVTADAVQTQSALSVFVDCHLIPVLGEVLTLRGTMEAREGVSHQNGELDQSAGACDYHGQYGLSRSQVGLRFVAVVDHTVVVDVGALEWPVQRGGDPRLVELSSLFSHELSDEATGPLDTLSVTINELLRHALLLATITGRSDGTSV